MDEYSDAVKKWAGGCVTMELRWGEALVIRQVSAPDTRIMLAAER
jgi:hypothetical protein